MLISKTVLSSFVLSLSVHCAGIFILTAPEGRNIVPLGQICAYTEVTFIDSQAVCEVMEVKDEPLTRFRGNDKEKKSEVMEIQEDVLKEEDKDFKKETSLTLKEVRKEEMTLSEKSETTWQNENSGGQNKNSKHSRHSQSLGASLSADKENSKNAWRILKCPMPVYPQEARKNLQEGEVIIEITVSPYGKIASSKVISSSGHTAIDETALKASKRVVLKYKSSKPASSGVTLRIPYQFKLK